MSSIIFGEPVAKGKTKELFAHPHEEDVLLVRCKDVITRNDDPNQTADAPGKGKLVAAITERVFRLFHRAGLPVAYVKSGYSWKGEFMTRKCQMIPLECVARRFAAGSYCARFPDVQEDVRFGGPVIEFFLKTNGGRVQYGEGVKSGILGIDPLKSGGPIEDPWIDHPFDIIWKLRHPKLPVDPEAWSKKFRAATVLPLIPGLMYDLEKQTRRAFLVLEKAWAALGYRLIDFKLEFGIDADGVVCIADEMSPDSWRLKDDQGRETSKELFRKGSTWKELMPKYHIVADLVRRFPVVKPGELEAMDPI